MAIVKAVLMKRFSEPSTWAGLAGLAVVFGMSEADWETVSNTIAGVFAVLAIVLREGSEPEQ